MRQIVISGPDGTGKSTLIRNMSSTHFDSKRVLVTWRRSGFLFARVFNLIARLAGRSFYEDTPLGRIGYHRYSGIWGKCYVLLVWLDCNVSFRPVWMIKDHFNRKTVDLSIVDRYYLDIVADLILSTENCRFCIQVFDTILRGHLSAVTCVVLSCHPNEVLRRRPDIKYDRDYAKKQKIYTMLRRLYKVQTISTDKSGVEDCVQKLTMLIG